jgi:hypothetical protein
MEANKVEQMLDKYWEGHSSLEEEKQLRQFFQSESVPAHLESDKMHFMAFSRMAEEKLDPEAWEGIEERLEEHISSSKVRRLGANKGMRILLQLAAAVLLFIGVYSIVPQQNNQVLTYQPGEEEAALKTASEALYLLSAQLQRGQSEAARLGTIENATRIVEFN